MKGFVAYYLLNIDELELEFLKEMKKDDPESLDYDELICLKKNAI